MTNGFHFVQALIALKKGAQLLKYGRKGKPKVYPFRLSIVSPIYLSCIMIKLLNFLLPSDQSNGI